MSQSTVLTLLVEEMRQNHVKVVDLTQPLDTDTPVVELHAGAVVVGGRPNVGRISCMNALEP